MSNKYNKISAKIVHTEAYIRGLSAQLNKLSPDRANSFKGLQNHFKAPASYEGMLGSVMVEGFLSTAFGDALANDNSIGANAALYALECNLPDIAEQFGEEREKKTDDDTHNNFGRGRGSIALYERLKSKPIFAQAADPFKAEYFKNERACEEIEQSIAANLRIYESDKSILKFAMN